MNSIQRIKIYHHPSGTTAYSDSENDMSEVENKKIAFSRLVSQNSFISWLSNKTEISDNTTTLFSRLTPSELCCDISIEENIGGEWVEVEER